MPYDFVAIPDADVPRATDPLFQHLLDTYASETNKVISVWRCFAAEDLAFRPHPKSSTGADILKHQLLSERRFFGEFVGTPEPPAAVLPTTPDLESCIRRMEELDGRGWLSLPGNRRNGGRQMSRSSGSHASASGFSGGASCTPASTARSSRYI